MPQPSRIPSGKRLVMSPAVAVRSLVQKLLQRVLRFLQLFVGPTQRKGLPQRSWTPLILRKNALRYRVQKPVRGILCTVRYTAYLDAQKHCRCCSVALEFELSLRILIS